MIGVIDYGMGNLASVLNAFAAIDHEAKLVYSPDELTDMEGIVLPGVGAYGDGMASLDRAGFTDALPQMAAQGRPILGICLGMQLLSSEGTEHGHHTGLNLIAGTVSAFHMPEGQDQLRVPHIGWNDVRFSHQDGLFEDLGESQAFYFVHSYVFAPVSDTAATGISSYGVSFAACVEQGNVCGVQFHPEKSHKAGLKLLCNWARIL